jgi:hypothetical protein
LYSLIQRAIDARFFQALVLRRPDFFFFQSAMEPFDVTVAFWVMIRGPSMGDAEPPERFQEPRRSELCPIVGGQRNATRTGHLISLSSAQTYSLMCQSGFRSKSFSTLHGFVNAFGSSIVMSALKVS